MGSRRWLYSDFMTGMPDRELYAEILKSGTWLYDQLVPSEAWIVRQTFKYHYEADYADEPEKLNEDGECFAVICARGDEKIGRGSEEMSLADAIASAERSTPRLTWDDHLLGKLYRGRWHSRRP